MKALHKYLNSKTYRYFLIILIFILALGGCSQSNENFTPQTPSVVEPTTTEFIAPQSTAVENNSSNQIGNVDFAPSSHVILGVNPTKPMEGELTIFSIKIIPLGDFQDVIGYFELPPMFEITSGIPNWEGDLTEGEEILFEITAIPSAGPAGKAQFVLDYGTGEIFRAIYDFSYQIDVTPDLPFMEPVAPGEFPIPTRKPENEQTSTPSDVDTIEESVNITISGQVQYREDLTTQVGAQHALIRVLEDDATLTQDVCEATADVDGNWSCSGSASEDAGDDTLEIFAVVSAYNPTYARIEDTNSIVYQSQVAPVSVPSIEGHHENLGLLVVPDNHAGAYHILKTLAFGNELSRTQGDIHIPPIDGEDHFLTVVWPGLNPTCTSYYHNFEIHIEGDNPVDCWPEFPNFSDNPSEWDESVILHEYGHYLMSHFATMPPVDYCNDPNEENPCTHEWDSHENPEVAYLEGWANYYQSAVKDTYGLPNANLYQDSFPNPSLPGGLYVSEYDLENVNNDPNAGTWDDVESTVAGILWDIYDTVEDHYIGDDVVDRINLGHDEIHQIFSVYDPPHLDHDNPFNIHEFYDGLISEFSFDWEIQQIFWGNGIDKVLEPDTPTNIAPFPNGVTDQLLMVDLIYSATDPDNDPLKYTVYLEAGNPNPSAIECNETDLTYCTTSSLSLGTTYYWKVIAQDPYGKTKEGPIWSFSTINPDPVNILSPITSDPVFAGTYDNPEKIQVQVTNVYSGLTASAFTAKVGQNVGQVVTATEFSDRYVLEVMPPNQAANGLYDLEITIEFPPSGSGVTLSDMETNAVNYTDTSGADIVLVIDRSGSMGTYGYMEPAKQAASIFVDLMHVGDMIGVVRFDSDAYLSYQLTEINSNIIKDEAKAAIDAITAYGNTSIGDGLYLAHEQLITYGNPLHPSAIVLLSDGYENSSMYVSEVLPAIIADQIPVHTIALGSTSDQALLMDIASQTGGSFHIAPSAQDLSAIYSMISGMVSDSQLLFQTTGDVNTGETDVEDVLVDSSVDEATFAVNWSNTSSVIDVTLQKPDGTNIGPSDAASNPDIDYLSGPNYSLYRIKKPTLTSGTWKVNISGTSVATINTLNSTSDLDLGGEQYLLRVTGLAQLTMNFTSDKQTYETGDPIKLIATLSSDSPVTGANVQVTISTSSTTSATLSTEDWISVNGDTIPNLEKTANSSIFNTTAIDTITLYDDGAHGDGLANDGIYANTYTGASSIGTYYFEANATGTFNGSEPFTRIASFSRYCDSTYDLTIIVDPAGTGTTNPAAGVHTYSEGTVVDVAAFPNTGYAFDHWSGACTGTGACQVIMDADKSVTATFTSGDSYEPDNDSASASVISDGESQSHSILPADDEDWVTFTLASESNVVLRTSGSTGNDTRMWLYDSSLNQVEYDDDDGTDYYSYIDRVCGVDSLPAGVYYVKVDEYGKNDIIPEYQLSLYVAPCMSNLPDLTINSVTISPTIPVPLSTFTATVQVENIGAAPAGLFYVDIYLDRQPSGCGDYGDYYTYMSSLDSGESINIPVTISGGVSSGSHQLYAYADIDCIIDENHETNNQYGPVNFDAIQPLGAFNGAVEITSDQPIVSIARPHLGIEIAAYNGVTDGSLVNYLPMLFNDIWGGFTATFTVQNVTNSTATYTITFQDAAATKNATACILSNQVLEPHGVLTYDMANLGTCDGGVVHPIKWVGSAMIESDHELAVMATPYIYGTDAVTYTAFSDGAPTAYLPMLFRGIWGFDAAFYVQNLDPSDPANITIDFFDNEGNYTCTYDDPVDLAPADTRGYWMPNVVCDGEDEFPTKLVDGEEVNWWAGSAVIKTQVGEAPSTNIVALARPHIWGKIAVYNGYSSGATQNYLPMLFREKWDFNAAIYVQNITDQPVDEITITFFDVDGNETCIYTDSADLSPYATRGYWMPQVSCNDGRNFPATGGWYGSAVIETNVDVVVVARPHLWDDQVVAYNAFTSGTTGVYVPYLFRSYGSNESALYIQNLGASPANTTINFYDEDSGFYCTMNKIVQPGASAAIWLAQMDNTVCVP